MAVTFNPSVQGSYQTIGLSYLDTKFNEIRTNTNKFPSGLLVHWADNCFNLKSLPNLPTLSEQVRWQVFFAAFAYFDPTTGPELGNVNGGQFFVDPLSPQDLAVLYRIISSYHTQYEKNQLGSRTVFQKHLTIMENRFRSSVEMTQQSVVALEALRDPALQDLIARLNKHLAPVTLKPCTKTILSNFYGNVIAKFGDIEVRVLTGNLLYSGAEAIVNPANMQLMAGSGMCGEIYKHGGYTIFAQCANYLQQISKPFVEEGHAMITTGGSLQAKHVIHAVGPFWAADLTPAQYEQTKLKLYNAYMNSLLCAAKNNVTSIAFPSISTGKFNFPLNLAGPIAIQAFKDFSDRHQNSSVKTIIMALGNSTIQPYRESLLQIEAGK